MQYYPKILKGLLFQKQFTYQKKQKENDQKHQLIIKITNKSFRFQSYKNSHPNPINIQAYALPRSAPHPTHA